MCGAAFASALVPTLLAGAASYAVSKLNKPSSISMPQIEVYQSPVTETVAAPTQGPEAPMATPIMTTQGQGSAEDEQKDTLDRKVRQNKKGRSMLRIDRTQPNTSGLGAGSGINVPTA